MTTVGALHAREAYDACAPFYDRLTHAYQNHRWLSELEAIARAHGLEGRRALDVACGTGKSSLPLLELGYDLTGCDLSPRMLREARRRLGAGVPLLELDMRELPALGPFDLVTCLNDAVNYLLDERDLAAALDSAARCLRPGGLYLCDLNNLLLFRTALATTSEHELDGWRFRMTGHATPYFAPGELAETTIEAFAPGAAEPVATSRHLQRHHPHDLVERLLGEAGLELLALYGQSNTRGGQEPVADELVHEKAIVVARRLP